MDRTLKVRSGFGRWSEVWYAICPNGHQSRMLKSWHGPAPVGAAYCSQCSELVGFETFRPVKV